MFYEAVYQPEDIKKLSSKAKLFIGKKIAVQDGGREELTPGKSQIVYISSPNIGIIPNNDLKKITSIPHKKWIKLSEKNEKKL